jgi:hypothetical protein
MTFALVTQCPSDPFRTVRYVSAPALRRTTPRRYMSSTTKLVQALLFIPCLKLIYGSTFGGTRKFCCFVGYLGKGYNLVPRNQ